MKLTREKKSQVLGDLKGLFKDSSASVASNYSGLAGSEITELRKSLRGKGIKLAVTKNTLVKKALADLGLEISQEILDQPVIFAFGEDEVEVCKLLHQFAKEHEKLKILGGIISGEQAEKSQITALALLPGREELEGKLVGILAAPAYGLVNVLHGNIRGLVNILNQYKNKLES
jgi:large subunit ribosomal protein L10